MTDTNDKQESVWVGEPYRGKLQTQSYTPRPQIEGIALIDLRMASDEGGDFCEITRFLADGHLSEYPRFTPAQISYSLMEPGTIKAWHLHRRQDDLWFIPPAHRLLIGLLDVRDDSPTYQLATRFVLGVGRPRLLYIPCGVAHGVANLGTAAASLLYFVNQAFDPDNPDEHRLPHDLLGGEFWTIRPG